jgi:hypothetical protein
MIPYEDLVIALQTWRAKQGLPVAQLSGALTPPPGAATAPAQRPPAQAFPPGISTPTPLPPPMAGGDDHMDVDDAALLEESSYDNEGADYAMNFGGHDDSSTAIGQPPPAPIGRPSEMTLDESGAEVASPGGRHRGNNRNDDW